jgi:phosphinothricin acetyltransferase
MMRIRLAGLDDLEGITEIYNDAILKTTATFDTETKTLDEQKQWFEEHDLKYPILVAEKDGLIIVGWVSLSQWSGRCAYSDTAEISVYVREAYRGKGIGKKLVKAALQHGEKAGLHTVIARIADSNVISIHIFETFGFSHIGIMKEVGKKFEKLIDVCLMQKIYDS